MLLGTSHCTQGLGALRQISGMLMNLATSQLDPPLTTLKHQVGDLYPTGRG